MNDDLVRGMVIALSCVQELIPFFSLSFFDFSLSDEFTGATHAHNERFDIEHSAISFIDDERWCIAYVCEVRNVEAFCASFNYRTRQNEITKLLQARRSSI